MAGIPSLSTSSSSGANGNIGGGLDAGHLLNEGDWVVSTGSAPAGVTGNKAIVVAVIAAGAWWVFGRKSS